MEYIHILTLVSICVYACGQSEGLDISNETHYNAFQQMNDEFIKLCPYTKTCHSVDRNASRKKMGEKQPCCMHCSCEDDCGVDCCPDKSFVSEGAFYHVTELIQCVDAKYKSFFDYPKRTYTFKMVASCPFKYVDNWIAENCRREYREFDFKSPLRYFLPAYDQNTDSIYKNIYCAMCHNVDLQNLDFAHLSLSCKKKRKNLTYIRDLASTSIKVEDNCNFRFFPSPLKLTWTSKLCDEHLVIGRCNVTGKWKNYDNYLEAACLSYKSLYNGESKNYRNIHCLLCNGFEQNKIKQMCPHEMFPSKMIAVLDFRNLFTKKKHVAPPTLLTGDVKEDNVCSMEDIYDPSKKKAWDLQCPFGMVHAKNICFPPRVIGSEKVVMHTSLLFEPDYRNESYIGKTVYEMLSRISIEIENVYSALVTKNVMLPYLITGLVQFETSPDFNETTVEQLDMHSIKHISVQVKARMNNIKDTILPILDFALVFVNITQIGNFTLKLHRTNSYSVDKNELELTCSNDTNHPNIHLCHEASYFDKGAIKFKIFQTDTYKHQDRSTPEVVIGVEREPFCPRIALKKIAFTDTKAACNESKILSRILTSNFISKLVSENETHLFFCYRDYFHHLKHLKLHTNLDQEQNTKNLVYTYLSLVCLCASIASLFFTIVIYSMFSVLRTLPGLNNLALSVSLLVYHSFALVNTITFVDSAWLCSVIGIVTHFSIIASFSWMFICTFHMMKVFIKIRNKAVSENISRTFVIYNVCGISAAVTSVVITIGLAEANSDGQDIGYGGIGCYIKDPFMILTVVALPVASVVILNFCMFCVVLFQISRLPNLAVSKSKERRNIVIFIKLSTLTGFSWIFGFIYLFVELDIFGYIFVLLNGGQGVFIMFSFIVNRRVWNLIRGQGSDASKPGTLSTNIGKENN